LSSDPTVEPWTCPNCKETRTAPFCPGCGERPFGAGELTLRGFLHQSLQSLSHIDGRVLRSFRLLLTRPGALTVAYLQGQRKPYLAPLQLFLVANVLFFAMQSLTGAKIFSTPLDSHLHHQMWSSFAQELVAQRLLALHTTLELYAPVFDHAVALNAKSLIILMVLPFAVLLPAVFRRTPQPFVAHVAFSFHFYAFLLLLFCLALIVVGVDQLLGGEGLASNLIDQVLSVIEVLICAAYLYVAVGTVYEARGVARVLEVAALAVSVAFIVLGYRFVLLLITLYST
jgi:hypothetical protein